jgi:hypothetical protein
MNFTPTAAAFTLFSHEKFIESNKNAVLVYSICFTTLSAVIFRQTRRKGAGCDLHPGMD